MSLGRLYRIQYNMTLTVGELIDRLKKMPKSANVYMLTDRTESNRSDLATNNISIENNLNHEETF